MFLLFFRTPLLPRTAPLLPQGRLATWTALVEEEERNETFCRKGSKRFIGPRPNHFLFPVGKFFLVWLMDMVNISNAID
jgi:hypothetical protein